MKYYFNLTVKGRTILEEEVEVAEKDEEFLDEMLDEWLFNNIEYSHCEIDDEE